MMKANPDFIFFYTRSTDNNLHKAAFRGNIDKVKELLNDPSISVYKPTSNRQQTALSLAIGKAHVKVVDVLLNVYENDLNFVNSFLKTNNIKLKKEFECGHSYVVAIGSEQIEKLKCEVSDFIGDITKMSKEELAMNNCNVILMKTNSQSKPEALFLFPRNRGDKMKLLNAVCDLVNRNGVCSINYSNIDDSKSVMHYAAMAGATDLVTRLLILGGNCHQKDFSGQSPQTIAFNYSALETFVKICKYLNQDMENILNAIREIQYKRYNNATVCGFIEYLTKERTERYHEAEDEALKNIFSNEKIVKIFTDNLTEEQTFNKYQAFLTLDKVYMICNQIVLSPLKQSGLLLRIIEQDEGVLSYISNGNSTIFHSLILFGWLDAVRAIYNKYPKAKGILFNDFEVGMHALKCAIENNFVELAAFLLDIHQDDLKETQDWSRLLISASLIESDVNNVLLKRILDHPFANPNIVVKYEGNCLQRAIQRENYKNVKLILTSGKVDTIDALNSEDCNILSCAIHYKYMQTYYGYDDYYEDDDDYYEPDEAVLLKDEDTDDEIELPNVIQLKVNEVQPTDELQFVISEKYHDANEVFNDLVTMGANIFVQYGYNNESLLHKAVRADNDVIVSQLLNLGVDWNKRDVNGNAPVHIARSLTMLQLLISKTSPKILEFKCLEFKTLLHKIVIWSGDNAIELLNEILSHNVLNINDGDSLGNAPLHYAASETMCEYLLHHGADPKQRNNLGETPIYTAISCRDSEQAAAYLLRLPNTDLFVLTNEGLSYLSVFARIRDRHFHRIKESLEQRKDEFMRLCSKHCNDRTDHGTSIFLSACSNNKYIAMHLMTQSDLIVDLVNANMETPLHSLYDNNTHIAEDIATMLIERKANINAVTIHEETPLSIAVKQGSLSLVELLIKSGADVNFKDSFHNSILQWACSYGRIDIVKLLMNAGSDVYSVNSDGKVPFEYFGNTDYLWIWDNFMR